MIISLAWKNIWRSRKRSFVVMGAITLGVWALIFIIAFYNSFGEAFTRSAINHDYSHLQIHHPDFLAEPDLKQNLRNAEVVAHYLENRKEVVSYSSRQKINGMIASPKNSFGIQVFGIEPDQEAGTTKLKTQLVDGTYFEKIRRNPILISQKMADRLKVKIRSKVVLTFQDKDRNITAGSFRVEGIFESRSPRINKAIVYVRLEDLSRLTGVPATHEMGILLENSDLIPAIKEDLKEVAVDSVRSYDEIAPEFNLMEESSTVTKQILTVIIMLALLFGIINTMLMAVLERTREIGMLRSVGMKKRSIFSMIIVETCCMAVIAGPLGLLLGFGTIRWLSKRGLDLSKYADALKEFGYDTVFFPRIADSTYPLLMLIVILTAFIGAIYPALKAIRLNPLEAIRKI